MYVWTSFFPTTSAVDRPLPPFAYPKINTQQKTKKQVQRHCVHGAARPRGRKKVQYPVAPPSPPHDFLNSLTSVSNTNTPETPHPRPPKKDTPLHGGGPQSVPR